MIGDAPHRVVSAVYVARGRRRARKRFSALILCVGALLFAPLTFGAPPAGDEASIQALEKQVADLNQELARLKAAPDPASQQDAMQAHWSMMQDHMRSMRQMPGMTARGCGDWMMMDPGMMHGGMMNDGMMNDRMGCSMMGHGMNMDGSGWSPPSGMTPGIYQKMMQDHMQKMHAQMAAIAAEKDPAKREALMREHYEAMYRDMQTMRGMGWMWTPNAAASLPEADSSGARLVSTYCGQCHAAPSPTLHTAGEWAEVTQRMRGHIGEQAASGSSILVPSTADLDALTEYMGKHARPQS